MTIEATGGKAGRVGRFGRRGAGTRQPTTLPIGESDANIFNCPACARPLGVGAPRCPGCGTRLIAGVQATRAVAFLLSGLVAGLLLGGGTMALVSALSGVAPVGVVQPPAVVTPSQVPVSTAPPRANPIDPGVPTAAISSLRQSAVLNARLAGDADRLLVVLAAPRPSAGDIAGLLRSMSATAAFGQGVAPHVGTWDAGAAVSHSLANMYDEVGRVARDGLAASISNTSAYVAAGHQMLRATGVLVDLDVDSRALAGQVDLELPPLRPVTP